MNNILSYKGYTAQIEFSADDNIFFGRVLGIRDVVTFHADTVADLMTEMRGTIDFYLEVCEREGKQPQKNYSGKLLFRLPHELHARIAEVAARRGKSINEWGKEVFEKAVEIKR